MSTKILRIKSFTFKNLHQKQLQKNHIMTDLIEQQGFSFLMKKIELTFIGTFEKKVIVYLQVSFKTKNGMKENLENDIQLSLWLSKKKSEVWLSTLLFILNKFKPKSLWTSGIIILHRISL